MIATEYETHNVANATLILQKIVTYIFITRPMSYLTLSKFWQRGSS